VGYKNHAQHVNEQPNLINKVEEDQSLQ